MANKAIASPEKRRPTVGRRPSLGLLPGLLLSVAVMLAAENLAPLLGKFILRLQGLPAQGPNPVSGILVAIVLGLVLGNTVRLPNLFQDGLSFSMKTLLRAGIVLVGIRLSLFDAMRIGLWGLPVVSGGVVTGLLAATFLGRRLGLSTRLSTLIAAGTGICGLTAIVSTAPAIGADDDEVSYAVANVAIFGVMGMLFYPYLAHLLFTGDPIKVGLFLGTAIHDTAQVAGAALIYGRTFDAARVVDLAVVTKLVRNLFLIGVVPLLAVLYRRRQRPTAAAGTDGAVSASSLFPTFVLGFVFMAAFRWVGEASSVHGQVLGFLSVDTWQSVWQAVGKLGSVYLLGTAMAAVGLTTDIKNLGRMGWRPWLVGLAAAVAVGGVAVLLATFFGPLVTGV